jgi:hypothetical protein
MEKNTKALNQTDIFLAHLSSFKEELDNSPEAEALKKADKALEKDPALLNLYRKKEEIEERLSRSVLLNDGKETEILKEYAVVNSQINALPSVQAYQDCYRSLVQIKSIFENKILRRLA